MKITDYRVENWLTLGDLIAGVKLAVADGWQPIGGVAVEREVIFGDGKRRTQYLQAMIRTEQPKAKGKQ